MKHVGKLKMAIAGLVAAGALALGATAQSAPLPPNDVGILGPSNPVTTFGLGTQANPVVFNVELPNQGLFLHTTNFSLTYPNLPFFNMTSSTNNIQFFSVPIFENIGDTEAIPGATSFSNLPLPNLNQSPGRDYHLHPQGLVGAGGGSYQITMWASPVPVPAAAWLFGSGVIGLVGLVRRKMRTSV